MAQSLDGVDVLCVLEVNEGSGAEEAGLRPGDVIAAADGQAVHTTAQLLEARRAHVVGENMKLTVLRGDERLEISVCLLPAAR